MSNRFVRRPSPATVIASIALFVSLGGVSYGVATGSIDSREIKNNNVRSRDLRNNDVRGTDIRTGTVVGSDVGDNSLTGSDILESGLGTVPSAASAGTANTANSAGNAATAGNALALGGRGPAGYQSTADLLFATLNTSATFATVLPGRGRGVTGATRESTGFYDVAFNRNVDNCTWVATGGRTAAGGTPPYIATTRPPNAGSPANEVGVVIWDAAGNQVDGASIFLSVLCP